MTKKSLRRSHYLKVETTKHATFSGHHVQSLDHVHESSASTQNSGRHVEQHEEWPGPKTPAGKGREDGKEQLLLSSLSIDEYFDCRASPKPKSQAPNSSLSTQKSPATPATSAMINCETSNYPSPHDKGSLDDQPAASSYQQRHSSSTGINTSIEEKKITLSSSQTNTQDTAIAKPVDSSKLTEKSSLKGVLDVEGVSS